MKPKFAVLLFAVLLICGYACKKDSNDTSIVGKWRIVKTVQYSERDTTINGTATDYYNFSTDGSLTILDHEQAYTGKYSQTSTSKVGIIIYTINGHGTGVSANPNVYTIDYLSNNTITITSSPYPSGQEIVYLQKN